MRFRRLLPVLVGTAIVLVSLTNYTEQYKIQDETDAAGRTENVNVPLSYHDGTLTDEEVGDIKKGILMMPPEVLKYLNDEKWEVYVVPGFEIPEKDEKHEYRNGNKCDLTDHKVYVETWVNTDYNRMTVNALSYVADLSYGDASSKEDFKELTEKYGFDDPERAFSDGFTAYLFDDDDYRREYTEMYVYFSDLTGRGVSDENT